MGVSRVKTQTLFISLGDSVLYFHYFMTQFHIYYGSYSFENNFDLFVFCITTLT